MTSNYFFYSVSVWLSTLILSPIIYYFILKHPGVILFEGSYPSRGIGIALMYFASFVFSLPAFGVFIFVVPLADQIRIKIFFRKTLIAFAAILLISLSFYFVSERFFEFTMSKAIYISLAIIFIFLFKFKKAN